MQEAEKAEYEKTFGEDLSVREDGLMVRAALGEPTQIVVPTEAREKLIKQ